MSKGTATEVEMCGTTLHLGDRVKVLYTTGSRMKGGIIEGEITELWSPELDNHLQARVDSGWCFHDHDEILSQNAGCQRTAVAGTLDRPCSAGGAE